MGRIIRRLIDAVVICLRIGLTLFIIWKSYHETGLYTTIALLLIGLYAESNTILTKRILASLKQVSSKNIFGYR